MQPYTFLHALPALLGFAGFALYHILGANNSGSEISRRIIAKLRSTIGSDVPPDQRLTPRQVERLLERRQDLKELVREQDFQLLKQALNQQFIITMAVNVFLIGFCAWTVYLFVQSPTLPQKASDPSGEQIHQTQSSTGKNAPNVISSGSGPVTVKIQEQAKPSLVPATPEQMRK